MGRNLVKVDLPVTNNYPYAAPLMAEWLELFHAYMRQTHGWEPVVNKLAEKPRKDGKKSISGTTHLDGYAVDWRTWNLSKKRWRTLIREASRFGVQAHYRTVAQGFQPHIHGMLDIGAWTYCAYQLDATKRGRSGLGAGGLKGPDAQADLRTTPWVTAKAGIRLLNQALNPSFEKELENMTPETEKKLETLVGRVIDQKIGRVPHVDAGSGAVDSSRTHALNTAAMRTEQQQARIKTTVYANRSKLDGVLRLGRAIIDRLDKIIRHLGIEG